MDIPKDMILELRGIKGKVVDIQFEPASVYNDGSAKAYFGIGDKYVVTLLVDGKEKKIRNLKAAEIHEAVMESVSGKHKGQPAIKLKRSEILHAAEKCICGKREQDYGTVEDNFGKIAELWTAYKGIKISPLDVAMMMALLKIARIEAGTATEDSFVDGCGYIACGGEIAQANE